MNKTIVRDMLTKQINSKKVLVLGDLMVDEYVTGSVHRISPEAPVPVLNYKERNSKAGGAANVAFNLNALGAKVIVAGVAAMDNCGMWMRNHLSDSGLDCSCIVEEKGRLTTVKTRFATKGQQLLRMDKENSDVITEETQKRLLSMISAQIYEIDGIVLSDYKKGVLNNPEFVKQIVRLATENNVLVAIDSKSRNIQAFANVDFVKPNNLELEEAVGVRIVDEESLEKAGRIYLEKSGARALVVTRGSKGISLFRKDCKRIDFPAESVQVFDVTGAGDTVISTIALSMICGLKIEESIRLANLAAGIVISKMGTVPVYNWELLESVNDWQDNN